MTYSFVSYSDTQIKVTEDSREYIYKKVYCTTSVDGDYFIFSTHNAETGLMMQQYKLLYTDCSAPSEASASALKTAVDAIINSYVGGGGGTIQNTAYVASYGNDGTAVIGDMFLPYSTLQGALDALRDLDLASAVVVALTADADATITSYDYDGDTYPNLITIDYNIVNGNSLTFNGGTLLFNSATIFCAFSILITGTTTIQIDDTVNLYCGNLFIDPSATATVSLIECDNYNNSGDLTVGTLVVKASFTDTGTTTINGAFYRTVPQGTATGDILRFDGTDWVRVAIGSTGQVLTVNSGLPSWQWNYSQINVFALTYNPTDAQTVFIGNTAAAPTTTAAIRRMYANRNMTIAMASVRWYAATVAGSAENISVYIRVNNTTDTLIATIGTTAAEKHFNNTGLSISLTAGDYFEIKIVQPTWVTNPTGVLLSGYVTIY
jgi:hypothetical protein